MAYTVVNDVSMLFDDSKVAIIPLNSNFEPDFKESEIYTSIFKVSYSECKRDFKFSKNPRKCYAYPIGIDKYVIYLVDINFNDKCVKEVLSVISRYISKDGSVSLLVKDLDNNYIKNFCQNVSYDVRVYNKALCI